MADPAALIGLATEVGPLVASLARRGRDAVTGTPEERALRAILDRTLTRTIDDADLETVQKEHVYNLMWSLLEIVDELNWLVAPSPAEVDDARLDVLRENQNVTALAIEFRRVFLDELRSEAGRNESPLHNRFTVEYLAETLNEVRGVAERLTDLSIPPAGPDSRDLAALAYPVSRLIEAVATFDPRLAGHVAGVLTAGESPSTVVHRLLHEPPSWLLSSPWEVFALLGEFAAGHRLHEYAAAAFTQAAEIAAQHGRRG